MKPVLWTILFASAFPGLAIAQPASPAPAADPVRPIALPMPEANPFACGADSAAAIVTRDLPSGIEATIPEFVSFRLDTSGKIQDVLLVHDPVPSLQPQELESFKKWEFLPPKKAGLEVAGWSTVRLDLKLEFSRPQITRADFQPVLADTPVPPPLSGRWDEGWIDGAPPLLDLKGAAAVEALDVPPLPKRTKWYADRYKGPFEDKVWIEVSPAGRASRIVPVEVKDPARLPYLKAAISRWTFTPARKGGQAVACWGMLDLGGTISYDVNLLRSASIKKSVGLAEK